MAIDERLRRAIEHAGEPADPSGVYEDLIRRHERRRVGRRLQSGALAIVVLLASGAGFVALTRAFVGGDAQPGIATAPTASNGMIVFERVADAPHGGIHLWVANPDGTDTQQLTFGDVFDRWASWSPDGSRVAFSRSDLSNPNASGLGIVDFASGAVTVPDEPDFGVARPDWSPDGSRIAFAGVRGETPQSGIYVTNADGSGLEQITDARFLAPDNPEWSSDGSTIAFSGNLDDSKFSWDVYLVAPDGSHLRNITNTADGSHSEFVIGWLPNGHLLVRDGPATISSGPGLPVQMERWLEMTLEGELVRVVYEGPANTEEARQEPSISPDGRFVLFDTPNRGWNTVRYMDLETGAVTAVTSGTTPAWQPVPSHASIVPTPTESPTPSPPGRFGEDLGLGFPVCNVSSIKGRFAVPDTDATVFVATRANDAGGCPQPEEAFNVVALDMDQDGIAETSYGPIECTLECRAFSAPDVDGDGTDELLVVQDGGAVVGLRLYDAASTDGGLAIVPVNVAEPGDPRSGLLPGEQASFLLGGDEFELYTLRCEEIPLPWRLGLVATSAEALPHDSADAEWHAHQTTSVLRNDRLLHVLDVRDFMEPVTDDPDGPSFASGEALCGSNLGP
jgi:Tol biopolymer transport system component